MTYEPLDLYNEVYSKIVKARADFYRLALDEGYTPNEIEKIDDIYAHCLTVLKLSHMRLESMHLDKKYGDKKIFDLTLNFAVDIQRPLKFELTDTQLINVEHFVGWESNEERLKFIKELLLNALEYVETKLPHVTWDDEL